MVPRTIVTSRHLSLRFVHTTWFLRLHLSVSTSLNDRSIETGSGPYTFRIQGALCHRIGQLLPDEDRQRQPSFAQVYVHDTSMEAQVDRCTNIMDDLNKDIVAVIQNIMMRHNPLAKQYISAGQQIEEAPELRLVLKNSVHNLDQRRYNLPTAEEVAAIFVNNYGLTQP